MPRFILAVVLLAASTCASQSSCSETLHQALVAYGCIDSLKTFPTQMRAQAESQMSQDSSLNDQDRMTIVDAMVNSVDVDRLIKNVEADMTPGCDPVETKTVLAQINTPLVQKMRAMEALTNSPGAAQEVQNRLKLPDVQSPSKKRSAVIGELVAVTGAADIAVDAAVQTSQAMLKGMGAPASDADHIDSLSSQIRRGAQQQITQMMLIVYRDATDEELQKYVAVLGTKSFRDFNQSFARAMIKSFAEESRQAGMALRKVFEEKQLQRDKAKI